MSLWQLSCGQVRQTITSEPRLTFRYKLELNFYDRNLRLTDCFTQPQRRQLEPLAAPRDVGQLSAQAEPVVLVAHKLPRADACGTSNVTGPTRVVTVLGL